jgi:tripartite-type tricarboxylate transporter receptor subunit TctC
MSNPTLRTLVLAAGAVLAALAAAPAAAADYPDRPIQVIVPYDAGTGVDLIARGIIGTLSKDLGQPVVVVNQPGASTALGAIAVKNARPDGYTLGMLVISTLAVLPNTRAVQFSSSDYAYICQVYEAPTMVLVPKNSPYKDWNDMIAFAKANPGKLLYGSPGPGTSNHIAMASLLQQQGVKGVHVPLSSNPAVYQSMGRGEIKVNIDSVLATRMNDIRPLLVLSKERTQLAPDVPSAGELKVGFEAPVWGGLAAPKGIPAAVREKLSGACKAAVAGADYAAATAKLATTPKYRSGDDYAKYVESEQARYKAVVKELGLEPK